MSEYSIALEKQLEFARLFRSPQGQRAIKDYYGSVSEGGWEILCAILPDLLDQAESFYWSPQTCSLLEGTPAPPENWTWEYEDLLVDNGFAWFSQPLALPEGTNEWRDSRLCAMAWSTGGGSVPALFSHADQSAPCLIVTFRFLRDPQRNVITPVPFPSTTLSWAHGMSMGDVLTSFLNDPGLTNGAEPQDFERARLYTQYFSLMVAFIRDRLLIAPRQPTDRAARKRVADRRPDPAVRVVQLRRLSGQRATAPHADVEWSCQWIVRSHWRQQWYAKLGRHQPKLIPPYVKGPEDKPLKKPRATVFAVVR